MSVCKSGTLTCQDICYIKGTSSVAKWRGLGLNSCSLCNFSFVLELQGNDRFLWCILTVMEKPRGTVGVSLPLHKQRYTPDSYGLHQHGDL
jgi:hypothetical protein